MNIKQLKPYSFWIVVGVLVLIEIGFLIFWGQTDEAGHTPEQVKQTLDKEFKNLENLNTRANAGDPQGRFDPEVPLDIKNLTDKYLITERWKAVLVPIVQKYNQQLDQVHQDLIGRSAILHSPITDSEDPSTWYTAYESKTREILTALKSAGSLVIPDEIKDDGTLLTENEHIRAMAGFFTKGANVPQANEHALLTTRARIAEKISEVLIATKGHIDSNPVLDKHVPPPPESAGAVITGLDWKMHTSKDDLESGAVLYEATLTLQGSVSALVAVEGALEHVSSPVLVVQGVTLSEKASWKPGERKASSGEPMICAIALVVIDYTNSHAQTVPVAGAAGPVTGPAPISANQPPQGAQVVQPPAPAQLVQPNRPAPVQSGLPSQPGPPGPNGAPGFRPPGVGGQLGNFNHPTAPPITTPPKAEGQ
jgi:hypothetical protein